MCKVSAHAAFRAKQRWGIEKARKPEEIVEETFNSATVIGDYIGDNGNYTQFLLDKRKQRALIYDPTSDTVVTVYNTKGSPLAPTLYDAVIMLHKRRINGLTRRYKTLFKRYNAEREQLERDKAEIEMEIQKLKMKRDHITATLDDFQFDLTQVNSEKRSIVKSMAHYLSSPGNMANDEGEVI